jgi:hypothetical protein
MKYTGAHEDDFSARGKFEVGAAIWLFVFCPGPPGVFQRP